MAPTKQTAKAADTKAHNKASQAEPPHGETSDAAEQDQSVPELLARVAELEAQVLAQKAEPASTKAMPEAEVRKALTALDLEIAQVELETKRLNLDRAKHENREYKDTEEANRRKAEQAQSILASERNNELRKKAVCEHAVGGFGNEDTYQGDGKPSLVMQDLPVAGRKHIICFRCLGEWFSPDPNLKHTNIDAYADQLAEWNQMLKLLRKSMSKPLSGPVFQFEKNGIPVSPAIV